MVLLPCFVMFHAGLTGITPEVLIGERTFREVWPEFSKWLSEIGMEQKEGGRSNGEIVLVAHNARFERDFLEAEQERCGFSRCDEPK